MRDPANTAIVHNDVLRAKFEKRFWKFVEKMPSGCWLWTGAINRDGYGNFWIDGRKVLAHRVSWEVAHGRPIPTGLEIDHLCRVRRCVNPDHLEAVTPLENQHRGENPAWVTNRTGLCKRGHNMDAPGGHYIRKDDGRKRCLQCKREYGKSWDRRNRQSAKEKA